MTCPGEYMGGVEKSSRNGKRDGYKGVMTEPLMNRHRTSN